MFTVDLFGWFFDDRLVFGSQHNYVLLPPCLPFRCIVSIDLRISIAWNLAPVGLCKN